jgi:hypothetical protein
MLLLLSLLTLLPRCQCCCCCRWHAILPLPLVGVDNDVCSMNVVSSPAMSAHAVYQALKAHTLLDRPLPASCAGGKGGNDDGGTIGSSHSWIAHWIGMVLPLPPEQRPYGNEGGRRVKAKATKRVIAMATRAACNDDSKGNGGKSDGDGDKGGG